MKRERCLGVGGASADEGQTQRGRRDGGIEDRQCDLEIWDVYVRESEGPGGLM